MIIDVSPAVVDFMAASDPSDPKTVWGIRPLTYRETQAALVDTGKRPVAAMDLYLKTYQSPDHEETDEEALDRIRRQRAAAKEYSEEDKQLMRDADVYLAKYHFFVCSYAIQTIDGKRVSRPEVLSILDNMRPRDQVGSVLAEIASKVGSLTRGDDKKK